MGCFVRHMWRARERVKPSGSRSGAQASEIRCHLIEELRRNGRYEEFQRCRNVQRVLTSQVTPPKIGRNICISTYHRSLTIFTKKNIQQLSWESSKKHNTYLLRPTTTKTKIALQHTPITHTNLTIPLHSYFSIYRACWNGIIVLGLARSLTR
jgi:hypothetical protein